MRVKLNVGIDRCELGSMLVAELLRNAIGPKNKVLDFEAKYSEGGDWEPELILIPEIIIQDLESFKRGVESMCLVLNEDCIAVSFQTNSKGGAMIFNPNYTGEKFQFNIEYFVG